MSKKDELEHKITQLRKSNDDNGSWSCQAAKQPEKNTEQNDVKPVYYDDLPKFL